MACEQKHAKQHQVTIYPYTKV